MEKLKFTQIFREAEEKVLTDDEKLKLIIDANPGKEDKIYDEFDAASATNGLDDFFEKYKDVLEPKKEEPKESEAEDDYNEIIDDANTTEKVSPSENVNDAIEPIKKSDLQKTCEVLNISESDFAIFEKYRGYNTDNTPKDEIEVLFKTPDTWPVHVGDKLKNTDPLFKNIAYRNEFILWKWAVEIFEKNGYRDMYSNLLDKFTGSNRNSEMKSKSKELNNAVNTIRAHILGNKTKVFDYATNEEIEIPNTLIFYVYICIIPKLFTVAKSGMGTVRILSNKIHATLFRLAAGFTEEDDLYKDIILSSFNLFIGGMAGMRALYSDVFTGKTLTDNANANPLSIFDTGWLGNNAADIKNVYHRMNKSFEDVDDNIRPFTTKVVKKANGQGPIAFNGVNGKAMYYAGHSFTDDQIRDEYERGEIDDETYEFVKRDIGEARSRIREEDVEMSAFAYIASFVGSQFRNFLSEMVQAAASRLGSDVKEAIQLKYNSQQEIDDETDPVKKQKMIDDNKKWEAVYGTLYDKLHNGGISLDAPVKGKDGDAGTVADKIAAPSEEVQRELKEDLPKEFDNIKRVLDNLHNQIKAKLNSDSKDNNDIGRRFFSLLKLEQMLYASFKWLGYSPRQAFNFAFGYMYRDSTKKVDKAIIKPGLWNRLAVTSSTGTANNPDFGIGNTETRDLKNNTLIDSVYTLHNASGLWFLDKTSEGLKARDNFLKLLESYYSTTIGEFKDFVRPLQAKQNSSEVNLEDYISSLNISGNLWRPGESYMPNEINQAAFGVSMQSVMMKNQKDGAKVSKWVRTLLASNVNAYSFDPVLNPSSPTFEKNRDMVNTIKDITGINMYDYWDGQKVKKNELLAAFKNWEKESGDVFQIYGNDTNYASLNDRVDNEVYNKSSNVLLGTEKTSNKNGDFTRHRMVLPSDPDLVKRVSGITIPEALETFFGMVFREASAKEKSKKQRFTIN